MHLNNVYPYVSSLLYATVQENSWHGGHNWHGNDEEDCDPEGTVCTGLALDAHAVTELVLTLFRVDVQFCIVVVVVNVCRVSLLDFGRSCQVRRAELALAPRAAADTIVTFTTGSGFDAVSEIAYLSRQVVVGGVKALQILGEHLGGRVGRLSGHGWLVF